MHAVSSSSCPARDRTGRQAFTLIELLVVISIIGLLVSIALPALSQARASAKAVKALSTAKTLSYAFTSYSLASNGYYMSAYGSVDITVQDVDGTSIPKEDLPASRWPLQLGSFMGAEFFRGTIYSFDDDIDTLLSSSFGAYDRSLSSSFGINSYNVGGRDTVRQPREVRRPEFEAAKPSELIAFARSRYYMSLSGTKTGFFYVQDPGVSYWPDIPFSPTTTAGPASPNYWGAVNFEYGGRTVLGYCDGRADAKRIDDLRDMRLWNDGARRANDPAYVVP